MLYAFMNNYVSVNNTKVELLCTLYNNLITDFNSTLLGGFSFLTDYYILISTMFSDMVKKQIVRTYVLFDM